MRSTGSVTPSSRFLCRSVVSNIDPTQASVVVELGPGDGVITRYLLDRLDLHCKLIIFEINEVFIDHINAQFDDPRLIVIHDSAENMGVHFDQLQIEKVDYIVSGIPFVMLPDTLVESIVKTCRDWLKPGGLFIQFHYSPLLIGLYKRVFGNIDVSIVPLNFPPALVIKCRKE